MLKTALAYLSYKWSIFPLCPMSKVPALRKWQQFQTTRPTEALVKAWWTNTPGFNIALATGAISCIVVADCDTPEAVARYMSHKDYKPTLAVVTGQGMHFYHHAPGFRVNNAVRLLPDLDIRGDGGYVVAPPSVHPSGKRYHWYKRDLIQPLPGYILELVKTKENMRSAPRPNTFTAPKARSVTPQQGYLSRQCDRIASAPEGERNNCLYVGAIMAGHIVRDGGLTRSAAESRLFSAGIAAGLGEQEVAKTIKSGIERGLAD